MSLAVVRRPHLTSRFHHDYGDNVYTVLQVCPAPMTEWLRYRAIDTHTFLLQGEKTFYLCPPSDLLNSYQMGDLQAVLSSGLPNYRNIGSHDHYSMIDPENPDLEVLHHGLCCC